MTDTKKYTYIKRLLFVASDQVECDACQRTPSILEIFLSVLTINFDVKLSKVIESRELPNMVVRMGRQEPLCVICLRDTLWRTER